MIWMFHSKTLNNHINSIHERALKIITVESQLLKNLTKRALFPLTIYICKKNGNKNV